MTIYMPSPDHHPTITRSPIMMDGSNRKSDHADESATSEGPLDLDSGCGIMHHALMKTGKKNSRFGLNSSCICG